MLEGRCERGRGAFELGPLEVSVTEAGTTGTKCPFGAMIPAVEGSQPEPMPVRWTAAAEARP